MNIDTAQERDGGRVSSLAQQQPDKLKRGVEVWGCNCSGDAGRTLGFKTSPEYVVKC